MVHGDRREVIFESLVNPGRPIPPVISAITRITNDMVQRAPRFAELADQILAALAGRIFVAHNARFDWNFVSAELRRARALTLDGHRLCTVRLARRLVSGVRSCGLDNLTVHFGLENDARHRAAGDALVTAELLSRLLRLARAEGARTLQDLSAIEAAADRPRPPEAPCDAHRTASRFRSRGVAVTLQTTFQVGGLRCHTLEGGLQRLDGGAMFGVVPRTLWSRRIAPDERHRIPLAMRCLLIEHPDGLVLIDTAPGNKENAKFHDIYGIENQGLEGATQLEDALASAGFLPRRRALGDQHAPAFRPRRRQHVHRSGSEGRPTSARAAHVFEGDDVVQQGDPSSPAPNERTRASTCRTTSSRWRRRACRGCWKATRRCCRGSRYGSSRGMCHSIRR